MDNSKLKKRLKQGVFILDGGMGSQLIARNIKTDKCNDYLGIEAPDVIKAIHTDYFNAGSDAVITNSFGANKISLAKYNLADQCRKLCKIAAENARSAAGDNQYVLGDIGPCGDFLEPLGMLQPEQLKEAFTDQAQGLVNGGVHGFIIETMTALDEITIAVEAVQSISSDLPVFCSMAFDYCGGDFRTMMGVDVNTAVNTLISLGVDAVGFNCGTAALDQYLQLAQEFADTVKSNSREVLISAEPNAGKPELIDAQAVYKVTGEEFAQAIAAMHDMGISILGGCCGTGPEHIQAVAKQLKTK